MPQSESITTALAYYAAHGSALFPIPAGQKDPGNLVASFARDYSKNPAQWARWHEQHGCNFGLVAGPSNLLILDIDVKELGRDRAWSLYAEWFVSRGLIVPMPHVQTPSQGWHVLFSVPAGVDLRQPPLIGKTDSKKAIVDIRAGNGFVVCAGSVVDGKQYQFLSNAAPYPAPDALLQHCARPTTRERGANVETTGVYQASDIKGLIQFLVSKDEFTEYDAWLHCGMALKVELGEAGRDIWQEAFDDTVTEGVEQTKWDSFASDPTPDLITIQSLLKRAHELGWHRNLPKTARTMFDDAVANLAKQVGASLTPAKSTMPLAETQRIIAALGQPILDSFLSTTRDTSSQSADYPALPIDLKEHPLYDLFVVALNRIAAIAETKKAFRQDAVAKVLAVLHATHKQTFDAFCSRLLAVGAVMTSGAIDSAVKNFEWKVTSETNTTRGFIVDSKGFPAADNSDNVHVFARERGIKLRWNAWKNQAEVSDADRDSFIHLNDAILGDLMMDAENSHFNYHPSESRFKRGVLSIARKSQYDPVVERIAALEAAWDGTPRLLTWLSNVAHVPCDQYHQAVGRNLIGGLVRRARHPGCVQAETVIFISPTQGTGKSTLTRILALDPSWHTDSFKFDGRAQDTIPQLFGKWVVELSELAGMAQRDMEHVKSFLSATSDNFTAKYESFATDHPRRCVFIGTSNDKRPLIDSSGNRRFLPVHVQGEVDTDWLQKNIEQLIGEAAHMESQGADFSIPRPVWDIANRHQEAARTMGPVEELCHEWFADRPEAAFWILAGDIGHAFGLAGHKGRYASYLDKLGMRPENWVVPVTGRKTRLWVKGDVGNIKGVVQLVPTQPLPTSRVEMRSRLAT